MATSFAIAQKPERWDISRSKVARSGQRFWNGLTHCYPFWEGTGLKVYNVANPGVNIGTAADTVTTNWVRIKRLGGMVFFFNGDNLDVINAGTFDPPHAGTMLFGFDLTEDKTSEVHRRGRCF